MVVMLEVNLRVQLFAEDFWKRATDDQMQVEPKKPISRGGRRRSDSLIPGSYIEVRVSSLNILVRQSSDAR